LTQGHRVLILFLAVFLIRGSASSTFAQDQEVSDSLKRDLRKYNPPDSVYPILLKGIAINETDPILSESYADQLIEFAQQEDTLYAFLLSGYLQKGNANLLQGNLDDALSAYFQCLEVAIFLNDLESIGALNSSIADVYSVDENNDNAIRYYNLAIATLRQTEDSVSLGSALFNTGDQYLIMERYDTALQYFAEAGQLFKTLDYQIGIAYNLGNIGAAYAGLGDNQRAEQNINEAIKLLETLEDYYPISVYLLYMADIYQGKKDLPVAIAYAERALNLAQQYGLKDQISEANQVLSDLYGQSGQAVKSLQAYRNFIAYRDSVRNIESVQKMADLRTEYEVSQKQIEVDLLNRQKRDQQILMIVTICALFLIGILAFGLYRRNQFISRTNKLIEEERQRSDSLLLNILPEETAKELKAFGKVQAKSFESVTVLFADFKSFTKFAERLSPEELVESVDFYFSAFDAIMEKYELEKIKTVGDAYMCAGGLPYPSDDHAIRMVKAALEMIEFVENAKSIETAWKTRFEIRIGINTGPVVAGVVGTKKFAYDIYGDTVNVASRMESNSEAGKINISESTYELIKEDFTFVPRGVLQVKNRGAMSMYFVELSSRA